MILLAVGAGVISYDTVAEKGQAALKLFDDAMPGSPEYLDARDEADQKFANGQPFPLRYKVTKLDWASIRAVVETAEHVLGSNQHSRDVIENPLDLTLFSEKPCTVREYSVSQYTGASLSIFGKCTEYYGNASFRLSSNPGDGWFSVTFSLNRIHYTLIPLQNGYAVIYEHDRNAKRPPR